MEVSVLVIRLIAGIYGFLLFSQLVKMLFPNIDIPLGSEVWKERFCWFTLITTASLILFFFLLESGFATFIPSINPNLSFDYLEKYEPELGKFIDQIPTLIHNFFDDVGSFFREL